MQIEDLDVCKVSPSLAQQMNVLYSAEQKGRPLGFKPYTSGTLGI